MTPASLERLLAEQEPVVLDYAKVIVTKRELARGVDLFADDGWSRPDREVSLLHGRSSGDQIWRGIRLTVEPYRPIVVAEPRLDRFCFRIDQRVTLIDEELRVTAQGWRAASMRHFEKALLVRSGSNLSALVSDPRAPEETTIKLELLGWEITQAWLPAARQLLGAAVGEIPDATR